MSLGLGTGGGWMSLAFGMEGGLTGGGLGSFRLGADWGTASWAAKRGRKGTNKEFVCLCKMSVLNRVSSGVNSEKEAMNTQAGLNQNRGVK